MDLEDAKNIAAIAASVVTVVGGLSAGYWFLFTGSFKRRIQLDELRLDIFDIGKVNYLCELHVDITNKGQREHKLYNLLCEVRSVHPDSASCLEVTNLVQEGMEYYFVRAGIKQTFSSHKFEIPNSKRFVRATVVLTYEPAFTCDPRRVSLEGVTTLDNAAIEKFDKTGHTPHIASKIFEVAPSQPADRDLRPAAAPSGGPTPC